MFLIKKSDLKNLYQEDRINRFLIKIYWSFLFVVALIYYFYGFSFEKLLTVIGPGIVFIVPTACYFIFGKKAINKYLKFIIVISTLIYVYALMYIQNGVMDNAFYLFMVVAVTAIYFNMYLTLITTFLIIASSVLLFIFWKQSFFPIFTVSNIFSMEIAIAIVGSLIGFQTVLGKKLVSSHFILYDRATKDNLTDTFNRNYFDEYLAGSVNDSLEGKRDLSLLIFDVDNFKLINDTYGHPKGDDVLKVVAASLREACRKKDFIARIGGDEFAIIFNDTTMEEIKKLTDRCIEKVESNFADQEVKTSVSYGHASLQSGDTVGSLYKRADEELYNNKKINKSKNI